MAQFCHHFYWMVRNVVLLFVISEDTPGHSRYTCTQYRSRILHMSHSSILKNIKKINFQFNSSSTYCLALCLVYLVATSRSWERAVETDSESPYVPIYTETLYHYVIILIQVNLMTGQSSDYLLIDPLKYSW